MDTSNGMREFLAYHKRMLGLMAGVCLAVLVVLLAALRPDYSLGGGFALGAAAQLFKFAVLDVGVVRRIVADGQRAATTQLKASFLSLVVLGAGLAAVFRFDFNLWAFAAGIFLPRLILIADSYLRPNPFPETGNGEEAPDA